MKSNELSFLICIFIEIVWLTPFFVAAAILVYAKTEEAVDSRLVSRLGAANIFILTALAARAIGFVFKYNVRPSPVGIETAGVALAMVAALSSQAFGRLASFRQFEIGRRLQHLVAVVVVLFASMVLLGGLSPVLRALNIFNFIKEVDSDRTEGAALDTRATTDEKWRFVDEPIVGEVGDMDIKAVNNWVLSRQYDSRTRPMSAKELSKAKGLLDRMGNTYVPKKPIKRSVEKTVREKMPRIVEYAGVSLKELLPRSNREMFVSQIGDFNRNTVFAQIVPHAVIGDSLLEGRVIVTGLYTSRAAEGFFGRQFGAQRLEISGARVELGVGMGQINARWTKRRFAFEAEVKWSGEVPEAVPKELMQSIIKATVEAVDKKVQ